MGTPEFAVASLDALLANKYNVVAVVTAPDKPAGRGMEIQQSAVKKFAVQNNIPVLQPDKLRDPQFLDSLKSYNSNIQVVVAFRMLPEVVWNMPAFGTINVHASLLPDYRGAAPINRAIMNGETVTGVTTFLLQQEIDTGNILLQKEVKIDKTDNAGTLHDKLKEEGAKLLIKTLEGTLLGTPQKHTNSHKHAPKIFPADCEIDWNKPAENINNLIRGLSPYPTAFTKLEGKKLKIFSAEISSGKSKTPGEILTDGKTYFEISCADKNLKILNLQLEGKKRMPVEDFLRGYRFQKLSVG